MTGSGEAGRGAAREIPWKRAKHGQIMSCICNTFRINSLLLRSKALKTHAQIHALSRISNLK